MPLGPGSIGPAVIPGAGGGGGTGTVKSISATAPIVATPTPITGTGTLSAPHVARKDVVTTQTFDGTVKAPLVETGSAVTFTVPSASIRVGSGAPASTLGTTGDFYYNKTGAANACLYVKRSGAWSLITTSVTKVTMGGDVTGTSTASTVVKLRGRSLHTTAPTATQVYAWTATNSYWLPKTISAGSAASGTTLFLPNQLTPVTYAQYHVVLPNSPTYTNGTAGVGATLTATTNGALVVDGHTFTTTGTRVAVCSQTTRFQNGFYTVTTAGSGSSHWKLTRATTTNTSAKLTKALVARVKAGTTWKNAAAILVPGTWTFTIGTTNVYAFAVKNANTGSYNSLAVAGVNGVGGSTIHMGSGPPPSTIGINGSLYINTTGTGSTSFYIKRSTTWFALGGTGTTPYSPFQMPSVTLAQFGATLPRTPAYTNTNGTLTATVTGTLTVDSVATGLTKIYAVCSQTTAKQNGIYKMTRQGSASAKYRLTRVTTANSSPTLGRYMVAHVKHGTVWGTGMVLFTPSAVYPTFTMGTTSVTGHPTGSASRTASGGVVTTGATGSTYTIYTNTGAAVHARGTWAITFAGGFSGSVTVASGGLIKPTGSFVTATCVTILTPITVTSGTAFQVTATKDTEIFFDVTLAGTITMTYASTSAGTAHSLLASAAVVAGTTITKRIPAGWYVKITLTTATISTVKAQTV